MHFEPANKEKKRLSVWVPLGLLLIWIIASTGYWMCGVKGLCGGSSVIDKTPISTEKN